MTTPLAPASPYGRSKLMSEWMLEDLGATGALRYAVLRQLPPPAINALAKLKHAVSRKLRPYSG